jgi:hypothetical protein
LLTLLLILSIRRLGSLAERRKVHRHGSSFHAGTLLDHPVISQLHSQTLEEFFPQFRMGNGTATEEDRQLHLIPGIQKPGRGATLGFEVVIANLRFDPDLFELNDVLIATGIALFPALFVPEFSIVHQSTNGRGRVRGNLNEVEPALPGHLECLPRGDDPDLATFVVDEPHLADPNPLVDARLNWSGNSLPPELSVPCAGHTKKSAPESDATPPATLVKITTK